MENQLEILDWTQYKFWTDPRGYYGDNPVSWRIFSSTRKKQAWKEECKERLTNCLNQFSFKLPSHPCRDQSLYMFAQCVGYLIQLCGNF